MKIAQGIRTTDEPRWLTVLNAVERQPGVSRSDLLRLYRTIAAADLADDLAGLEWYGLIRREVVWTGGRPSECWWATVDQYCSRFGKPVGKR